MNNIKYALVLFTACFLSAFAQNEPEKLAVYVSGASDAGINKSFGNKLLATIVQSGKYAEIGDPEAFYKELARSNIDGIGQITQTAKQYGADFVCVVSMTEAFGAYSISARIVKIADSQIIGTALLDRSLKSLDDLTKTSYELIGQLLRLQIRKSTSQTAFSSDPNTPPPPPIKKKCTSTFNMNEFISRLEEEFPDQLKECSTRMAKNMARDAAPLPGFIKNIFFEPAKPGEEKEPVAFMMQCTINGIEENLLEDFPGADKYIRSVETFMQNAMSVASAANGKPDAKKLLDAVDNMRIDDLLSSISKQSANDNCMGQETSEESSKKPSKKSSDRIISGEDLVDIRDGKTYRTIIISKRTWMAENLNYASEGSRCYNENPVNCDKYGGLYDWATAMESCPEGWHVPSEGEWNALIITVGNFATVMGGRGSPGGRFEDGGRMSYWWTASEDGGSGAYGRDASSNSKGTSSWSYDKMDLLSVRCLKD